VARLLGACGVGESYRLGIEVPARMASMLDEQDLLGRVQRGDSGAFEQLLFAHHDRLLRSIGRSMLPVVRELVTEEDVLQETFIRAYRHLANFKPDGDDSFYRWLSTIANNHLRDLMRAQGAAKRGGGRPALREADMSAINMTHTGLLSQLAIDSQTPSRKAAGHEALTALQLAMAGLKAGSVDLVFADPPFNIGYDYDTYEDDQSDDAYLGW